MQLRIRFGRGVPFQQEGRKNRNLALAAAALLVPVALMAFALGLWRLGADMEISGSFAIREGLFSHWQVWMAVAALSIFAAIRLNRYGRGEG